MSGHSKWANIQHRKGRQDAKRSNMWTKIVREIIIAARTGGDPDMNPRLRMTLTKARAANVPKDTIKNAILKGTGQLEGVSYEETRYEGYGVAGTALIIDCTTDNKVRTVSDVRHILTSKGGSLGTEGSVAFMFKHCGLIVLPEGSDEDKVMEVALEAGAEDVIANDDGSVEVLTPPTIQDFENVQKALEAAGFTAEFAEITMRPNNETVLTGEDAEKMQTIIDALEDNDDVSKVYCSATLELPEDAE